MIKFSDLITFEILSAFCVLQLAAVDCQVQQSNSSGGNIVLNLQNEQNLVHKLVRLQPHSSNRLQATNINKFTSFILFQIHCQKENVSIQYYETKSYNSSVLGTSVGLVSYLQVLDTVTSVWAVNNNALKLSCVVAAVPHTSTGPVPGGCNNEFKVPTSPFLRLKFDPAQTVLEYQSASMGYKRSYGVQMSCDLSMYYISYEFYVIFLPEGEYGLTEYVEGLAAAMSWMSLTSKARKIKPYAIAPMKRLFFSNFPGQGVIYTIVSKYTSKINNSDVFYHGAYVPYVTYGCSFSDDIDGCYSINRPFTYVVCICFAIVGIILCFSGHHFFKLEMFIAGFLAASLLTFILVIKYTEWAHTDREIITMVCGAVGGFLWLGLWWIYGNHVISMLLPGVELGFLASSIVFFTPVGNIEMFRNTFNYWMTFSIGIVLIPVILLYFTKLLSIVFCAVMGSYGVIVAVDRYIRATLSYIILNVVKRCTYGSLDKVNLVSPFQRNDIILSVSWVILAIIGMGVQHLITKNRPPFPPSPYMIWKRHNQDRQATFRPRNLVRRVRGVLAPPQEESNPLVNEQRTQESHGIYGSVD